VERQIKEACHHLKNEKWYNRFHDKCIAYSGTHDTPQYDIITTVNPDGYSFDLVKGDSLFPSNRYEIPFYWINPEEPHEEKAVPYMVFTPTNPNFSISIHAISQWCKDHYLYHP